MDALPFNMGETPVGKRVNVVVIRDGESKIIDVEIGERVKDKDLDKDIEIGVNLGIPSAFQ